MTLRKGNKNIALLVLNLMCVFSILLLLLNSCTPAPIDQLEKKIKIALRNDNVIDEKEWSEFVEYAIENNKELPNLVGYNNEINNNKLNELVLTLASRGRVKTKPEIYNPEKIKEAEDDKTQIEVFIENSGSMDGYVRGTTEFEAALSDLLVQIQYKYDKENINTNFINTKVYPAEIDEVNSFVENLDPNKKPYKIGKRNVSKLNEILEVILNSTSQKNISILISDCIYSLNREKDTEGALEFQKSLTKGAFLEKSKEFNFSTFVLKMNSKFNGNYYNKNNAKTYLNRKSRPYYIWIMGSDKHISSFLEKIDLASLKGFENSYFLSNPAESKQPYYTILKETNKVGDFRQVDRKSKNVKSINNITYQDGTLQFAIAVDLNSIPVDQKYLMNLERYIMPDGFLIRSIEKIDKNKISRRDFLTIEKTTASHVITISISNKYPIQDLQLKLSNKIPFWIGESSSIDDRNVLNQLNKTFGLLYLVQGVSEAYTIMNYNNQYYFQINVIIKK